MAHDFIGETVLVTLRFSPDYTVQGIVTDVVDSNLILKDVLIHRTRLRRAQLLIRGVDIFDLEIAPPLITTAGHPAVAAEGGPPSTFATNSHDISTTRRHLYSAPAINHAALRQIHDAFADPSGRDEANHRDPSIAGATYAESDAAKIPAKPASPRVRLTDQYPLMSHQPFVWPDQVAATLTAPFDSLNLNGQEGQQENDRSETTIDIAGLGGRLGSNTTSGPHDTAQLRAEGYTGKRSRKGGRSKTQRNAPVDTSIAHADPSAGYHDPTFASRSAGYLKATKQDEVIGADLNHENGRVKLKAVKRLPRPKPIQSYQPDGWATEDAADIQGLDDFDFQGNLSKFDKSSVFEQIRADDTTADEARLVNHNRMVPRAGTSGGKNLHYTENVLDPPANEGRWNSEAGATEEEADAEANRSGRGPRKLTSRQMSRQTSSRKGNALTGGIVPQSGSPVDSTMSTSSKPTLRIIPSNRLCPVVTPLQMHDIESIAETDLGLTEEMMTENAARGIAQIAVAALMPEERRGRQAHVEPHPVVVVLAGNNKNGTRAVAAARHLRNHGIRVMVCVVALEREGELPESLQRQLTIFRKMGGKVSRREELGNDLASMDSPPKLIVDALLGMHVSLEDLRSVHQAMAWELIGWMNQNRADVLAVDLPTGVDASTGFSSTIDYQHSYVVAQHIVALGAPKTGLLHAMASGVGPSWQVWVADIGISNTAWRKYGTRRRHGVDFASDWVVGLRYQSGVE